MRHGDARLTRIGVCTADRAVVMRRGGAETVLPRAAGMRISGRSDTHSFEGLEA